MATSGGGTEQLLTGAWVLRGDGEPEVKSTELLSVSRQPLRPRCAEVAAANIGPDPPPSTQLALPYPMKSTTDAPNGHPLPLSGVVVLTSATLPIPAAILIEPVASGAGKAEPAVPPDASCTR